MRANELTARIAAKFASPIYATFTNVADGTGSINGRADAISMAAWKSRGYLVHGFEVKVSRSDWLRELKQPNKAELFIKYCDHWWLVAADKSIIKDGELPPTWGMMVSAGNGLAVVVKAPKLTPMALDKMFVASLLRSAADSAIAPELLAKARAEGAQQERGKDAAVLEKQIRVIDALQKRINDFEKASGISLNEYCNPKELGEAVKFVLRHDGRRALPGQIHRLRRELLQAAARLRKSERAIEALEPTT